MAVAISLAIAFIGVARIPATPDLAPCPGAVRSSAPATELSVAQPILLAACSADDEFPYFPIQFSLVRAATLVGDWSASVPTAVLVTNTSQGGSTFTWGCSGCYALSGTFNVSLFPGTYSISFAVGSPAALPASSRGQGSEVWYATRAIEAVFDRGILVLQPSAALELSPQGYLAWPIALTFVAGDLGLEGLAESNASCFETAILPPAAFATFEAEPSSGALTLGWLLVGGSTSSCAPGPTTIPFDNSLEFLTGTASLWGYLVVYNDLGTAASFTVVDSIEVSYLDPPGV